VVSSTEELPDLMLGTANENATTSKRSPEQMTARRILSIEGNGFWASQLRALLNGEKNLFIARQPEKTWDRPMPLKSGRPLPIT
jgi:hypothetical protein